MRARDAARLEVERAAAEEGIQLGEQDLHVAAPERPAAGAGAAADYAVRLAADLGDQFAGLQDGLVGLRAALDRRHGANPHPRADRRHVRAEPADVAQLEGRSSASTCMRRFDRFGRLELIWQIGYSWPARTLGTLTCAPEPHSRIGTASIWPEIPVQPPSRPWLHAAETPWNPIRASYGRQLYLLHHDFQYRRPRSSCQSYRASRTSGTSRIWTHWTSRVGHPVLDETRTVLYRGSGDLDRFRPRLRLWLWLRLLIFHLLFIQLATHRRSTASNPLALIPDDVVRDGPTGLVLGYDDGLFSLYNRV